MTRDFAKKTPPASKKYSRSKGGRSPRKSQVPSWVWLITGTALGAFIMFLVYLSDLAPQNADTTNSQAQQAADKKETMPKPRFDFYQLLKESEVTVNTRPIEQEVANASEAALEYILQVGSFKRDSDADRLRAELILLNLETQVETVTMRNGETWHRVLVGPYISRSKMAKARGILVSNDINPLLLKRKSKS